MWGLGRYICCGSEVLCEDQDGTCGIWPWVGGARGALGLRKQVPAPAPTVCQGLAPGACGQTRPKGEEKVEERNSNSQELLGGLKGFDNVQERTGPEVFLSVWLWELLSEKFTWCGSRG